ncbi:hypothetical protein E3P99_00343 [Wallemia hederae]|uniref:Zinc/iron permease n=1 Tax=Wallemia hederae TaxID=1540922 RepID=A0A4T0FXB4_9BASI|nr:hypothetical protein E3P99_00343 [Wallemia hederae]
MPSRSLHLLLICICISVGSLLAALSPQILRIRQENVIKLATLGAGLLVGSALGIVIPEGIDSVYDHSSDASIATQKIGILTTTGFVLMLLIDTLIAPHNTHSHNHSHGHVHSHSHGDGSAPPTHAHAHDASDAEAHASHTSQPRRMRSYTPLRPISSTDTSTSPAKAISKTAGLTIHALCDGIALGAATFGDTQGKGLSVVVFLAVAIHKAPASLGLSSSLLSLTPKLSRGFYRLCITAFALSTPFSAMCTYAALRLIHLDASAGSAIPAYALLFSGGTFLFVATQATSEQLECATDRKSFLVMYLVGIFAPVLVSMVFRHGH